MKILIPRKNGLYVEMRHWEDYHKASATSHDPFGDPSYAGNLPQWMLFMAHAIIPAMHLLTHFSLEETGSAIGNDIFGVNEDYDWILVLINDKPGLVLMKVFVAQQAACKPNSLAHTCYKTSQQELIWALTLMDMGRVDDSYNHTMVDILTI